MHHSLHGDRACHVLHPNHGTDTCRPKALQPYYLLACDKTPCNKAPAFVTTLVNKADCTCIGVDVEAIGSMYGPQHVGLWTCWVA